MMFEAILIIVGAAVLIWSEKFAASTIAFQNETFGYHYGNKEINATRVMYITIGLIAVSTGVLSLLGIIWN